MSRSFDIKELLHIAVIDERNGISMYRDMKEKAQSQKVRELFGFLSEQEQEHEKHFRELEEMVSAREESEHYPDEYVDYLEALVAEGTYGGTGRPVPKGNSDGELIDSAIRFERDQLSLQKDMGNILSSDHKNLIDTVINEERDHLVRLSRMKNELRKSG